MTLNILVLAGLSMKVKDTECIHKNRGHNEGMLHRGFHFDEVPLKH